MVFPVITPEENQPTEGVVQPGPSTAGENPVEAPSELSILPEVDLEEEPSPPPVTPEGYTRVRYTCGGWLGFAFGDNRYTVGTQPVELPDAAAQHAMALYDGQIVKA